jgi:hypothetical protein
MFLGGGGSLKRYAKKRFAMKGVAMRQGAQSVVHCRGLYNLNKEPNVRVNPGTKETKGKKETLKINLPVPVGKSYLHARFFPNPDSIV